MKRTPVLTKQQIGGLLTATCALWGAGVAAAYYRAFGSSFEPEDEERLATPGDYGIKYEQLEITTSDGIPLLGWYLPGKRDAVIIISGGYRGRAWDVIGMAVALRKAGYHVVVYGWRGTPGSGKSGHTLGAAERKDLTAVISSVRSRLGNMPIGLLGYSLGGAVSLSIAASDPEIFAVCTDSAFADPVELLRVRVGKTFHLPSFLFVPPVVALLRRRLGEDLRAFSPKRVVQHIAPRPLLLIHGALDAVVPLEDAHRLYDAALSPKSLWVLPKTGHVGAYFVQRARYIERVCAFFDHAVRGEPWELYDIPSVGQAGTVGKRVDPVLQPNAYVEL